MELHGRSHRRHAGEPALPAGAVHAAGLHRAVRMEQRDRGGRAAALEAAGEDEASHREETLAVRLAGLEVADVLGVVGEPPVPLAVLLVVAPPPLVAGGAALGGHDALALVSARPVLSARPIAARWRAPTRSRSGATSRHDCDVTETGPPEAFWQDRRGHPPTNLDESEADQLKITAQCVRTPSGGVPVPARVRTRVPIRTHSLLHRLNLPGAVRVATGPSDPGMHLAADHDLLHEFAAVGVPDQHCLFRDDRT